MSSTVLESPVLGAEAVDRRATSRRTALVRRGPIAWLVALVAWVTSPVSRGERGITTIEYIFGAILAIAIVTVAITVFKSPATADLLEKVIQFVLKFRGK